MNIAGISPQGFQRVNTLLGEVGRAIDPKSHAKTTVSDIEAKRIVQAFDKLEPNEKEEERHDGGCESTTFADA